MFSQSDNRQLGVNIAKFIESLNKDDAEKIGFGEHLIKEIYQFIAEKLATSK
jgi:hypothetical protein